MEIEVVFSHLAIGTESHRCTLKLRWLKVVLASAAGAFDYGTLGSRSLGRYDRRERKDAHGHGEER